MASDSKKPSLVEIISNPGEAIRAAAMAINEASNVAPAESEAPERESHGDIPTEFKSRPLTKAEIAKLWSGAKPSNPTAFLKRTPLTIEGEPGSKLWYVDLRQWPEDKQGSLK